MSEKKRNYTDDDLIALHGQGLAQSAIARRLKVSGSSVSVGMKRLGLTPNQRRGVSILVSHKSPPGNAQRNKRIQIIKATWERVTARMMQ